MNKETFISENKTIIDTDYYLKLLNCEQENQRKLYTSNGNKFTKYELLDDYERILQENQQLKENLEKKYKEVGTLTNEILYEENTKLLSVLDEIREFLNELDDDTENTIYDIDKIVRNYLLQILDKAKE